MAVRVGHTARAPGARVFWVSEEQTRPLQLFKYCWKLTCCCVSLPTSGLRTRSIYIRVFEVFIGRGDRWRGELSWSRVSFLDGGYVVGFDPLNGLV